MTRTHTAHRRPLVVALLGALVLAAALLAACGSEPSAKPASAAAVVDDLLRARSEGVTDTAYYERLVESSAVAQQLAADSASRSETSPPTPPWKTPRVTKETSAAAQVTVDWEYAEGFEVWPAWTQFGLKKTGDTWLVVEAADATTSVSPTATP